MGSGGVMVSMLTSSVVGSKNVFGFHSRKLFVLSKADSFFKRDRDVIVDESTTTYVMLSPLTL
jgi:hypothetical protein